MRRAFASSLAVLGTAATLVSGTPATEAQRGRRDPTEQRPADRDYAAGRRAFAAEQYDEAAVLFRRAWEEGRLPAALYNCAFALDRLGRADEALATYEEFLREVSDSPDRAAVESRAAELRAERQRQPGRAEPPRPPADPAALDPRVATPANTERPQERAAPLLTPRPASDTVSDGGRSVFEEPVFWIIAGVVLVGAGVATGLIVADASVPTFDRGTTGVTIRANP